MNFVGSCTNWLCRNSDAEKQLASPTEFTGPTPVTAATAHPTPGPSPGSSNSCDDVVPPQKNCYRLVMLGSARVGKTCLVARFLGGKFQESYTPTIEDFHRKLYRIRGEIHQLDLLDTSGNHPFPAMRRLSFLTGDVFVIVFSMDSRETFEEAIRLRQQILETKLNAGAAANSGVLAKKKVMPRVPMVLAGNKCDREMKTVSVEEAQAYCESQDGTCAFVETSAKRNLKVDEVFYQLFVVANLPLEMAPNHHKRVSASFGSPCPLPPSSQTSHHAKSGPRMNISQVNGNSRRTSNMNRMPQQQQQQQHLQQQQQQQQQQLDKHTTCNQHEELIKYIHDSWNKVSQELDRSNSNIIYYNEQEPHSLKNFKPFDLQAYWGRRIVQMQSHTQHS